MSTSTFAMTDWTTQSMDCNGSFLSNLLFNDENVSFEQIDDTSTALTDDVLHDTVAKSLEEGSATPSIKQELKCKIMKRRISTGAPDLNISFDPPKSYPLTPEEERKITLRRARNRQSARKSRVMRKKQEDTLKQELKTLETENEKLTSDVNSLRKKRTLMSMICQSHFRKCSILQSKYDFEVLSTNSFEKTTAGSNQPQKYMGIDQ